MPPLELRELVGWIDTAGYENPLGESIFEGYDPDEWHTYLDFGCGCGRSARRLILQNPRPQRYIGIDLHRGMIRWCQENLAPCADGFEFIHHDVFSPCLNPDPLRPWVEPLPVETGVCTLIEATSVFTHLVEGQTEFYLDEVERVLAPSGQLIATWFLFDKANFPYMQDSQNALYINDRDVTNAVAYDRAWLQSALHKRGLAITKTVAPPLRGFQWRLDIKRQGPGVVPIEIPDDTAPVGRRPPPLLRLNAERFGLDGSSFSPPVNEPGRQTPPLPNPLAVELQGAKEYIASLENEVRRLTDHILSDNTDGTV